MFRCVPHSLMDCGSKRARAARSKVCKVQIMFKQISEATWVYVLTFDQFVKIASPMQIVSKHSVLSKPVLRPFCLETKVYSPLPFVFLLTLTQSSARSAETFIIFNVYFLFLWIAAEEGRARSADIFSIYNSLSYGLRKKKAERSAEMFSKLTSIFLRFA